MILGLDISTSKVGFALIEKDGKLITYNLVKYKADAALEERADYLLSGLAKMKKKFKVKHVFVMV